ncbi:hypothetical protein NCAS_0A04440 [Naumovozyma castellii]|uniref:Protein kinase domain-containing protein n=1 Tax=Naumovozyma castellii TaxID=27288 RepID=G0V6B0_NAUCA|nr:hypothetical protein NCAS_0A04440 [Naumovozyma castellii CBS 4309]CCC67002.1 hypothetical protein NCAS_0A04440 [Naumovozyma castellii CBS 4309]
MKINTSKLIRKVTESCSSPNGLKKIWASPDSIDHLKGEYFSFGKLRILKQKRLSSMVTGTDLKKQEMAKSPKAPVLVQKEFANLQYSTSQNDYLKPPPPPVTEAGEENEDDSQQQQEETTPLSLTIPTFDNVQTLPTPMTYTPLSPAGLSLSPIKDQKQPDQPLQIKKKRAHGSPRIGGGLDSVLLESQQRVISELIPAPSFQQQRVVSLPTVNEEPIPSFEPDIIPKEFAHTNIDTFDNHAESTLVGYPLQHLDKAHVLRWKKVKKIGEGNFSDVLLYESLDQTDPKMMQIAVKRIKYPVEVTDITFRGTPQYNDTLSRLESSLTRELGVLKLLDYPCIVKLYGINNPIFVQSKTPLRDLLAKNPALPPCDMIMSYCSGGDLLAAISRCLGELDIWLIQRLFTELVMAVNYLHDNNIIHRDLKLENILLKYPLEHIIALKDSPVFTSLNMIELADFGLCKQIQPGELCTARCGSEDYVSPEILMGVPYDGHLTDTWALGVILYSILEDRLPFDPPPNATSRQRNRATSHRIARFDWHWFRLANTELDAKEIVANTLTRKNQRWDIKQIMESIFVKTEMESLTF